MVGSSTIHTGSLRACSCAGPCESRWISGSAGSPPNFNRRIPPQRCTQLRARIQCGCYVDQRKKLPRPISTAAIVWKIRCFGRLRIYRNDGSQVNWDTPGGATRKTKTLFAYLLQKGGHGAGTDDLADLLWPDAEETETARNRLYHTVRYLRLALGQTDGHGDDRKYIRRDGSRYVSGSARTQLARHFHVRTTMPPVSGPHQSRRERRGAGLLQAADRLYTGDLFEDIPAEYADNSERDWCWSKRYWLRDMFFKVQRDAARIYLERKDYSAALAHCQKALAIDPLCEMAHAEAMRVFSAQGRPEAIDRQFKLYLSSLNLF